MNMKDPAFEYLESAIQIIKTIQETQGDAIEKAAEICTNAIANRGLVHLFGTGHSRILVEEVFPRHGSFPGFHPIVELSMTNYHGVVGTNGIRQAMFLERIEGFAKIILSNFILEKPDCFIIFSHSGVNEVVVDMALEVKALNLPVIVVISVKHCQATKPKHSSGKRLLDIADVVIDNCAPAGDAMVQIEGLDDPVGPGSTIGGAAVVNALKCLVAQKLTDLGKPPIVLTNAYFIGAEKSVEQFNRCYDDFRGRVQRVYGCGCE